MIKKIGVILIVLTAISLTISGVSAFPVELDKYHIKNSIVKENLRGIYYQNQTIILQNASSDHILDVKITSQDVYTVYFNSTYKVDILFAGNGITYNFFGKRYVDDDKWYANGGSGTNLVSGTNFAINYDYKYPLIYIPRG